MCFCNILKVLQQQIPRVVGGRGGLGSSASFVSFPTYQLQLSTTDRRGSSPGQNPFRLCPASLVQCAMGVGEGGRYQYERTPADGGKAGKEVGTNYQRVCRWKRWGGWSGLWTALPHPFRACLHSAREHLGKVCGSWGTRRTLTMKQCLKPMRPRGDWEPTFTTFSLFKS